MTTSSLCNRFLEDVQIKICSIACATTCDLVTGEVHLLLSVYENYTQWTQKRYFKVTLRAKFFSQLQRSTNVVKFHLFLCSVKSVSLECEDDFASQAIFHCCLKVIFCLAGRQHI